MTSYIDAMEGKHNSGIEVSLEPDAAEMEAAQEEAYYHYVIQEFYAICKVFGTKKVLADLATFKASVEKPKDESRIQLL